MPPNSTAEGRTDCCSPPDGVDCTPSRWPWFWLARHRYLPLHDKPKRCPTPTCFFNPHALCRLVQLVFVLFTSFFLALIAFTLLPWPMDPFDSAFYPFRDNRISIDPDSSDYPKSFLHNVLPIPCHSHNDYWRSTPLYAALGTGCVGIEADVWLVGNQLYVGHTEESILMATNGTLEHMYIDPLVKILDSANRFQEDFPQQPYHGVFDTEPSQTLTLLIDIKTGGAETWPHLYKALEPLRERGWLSHWNGTHRIPRPITVVGTGTTPYDLVVANQTYRDIFLDAPLASLIELSDVETAKKFKYNPSNSHYASAKLSKAIGDVRGPLASEQRAAVRQQIKNAHVRGLVPRYWGTPRWPRGLRDSIWEILLQEDIGLLNVDDLRAVRKGHWGVWPA